MLWIGALKRCSETERAIVVSQGTERVCIGVSELKYIEIFDHHIQYRTTEGVVKAYGSLKAVEKQLPETGFFRMNNQTIVNLKYVTQVSGGEAMIGDKAFPISRMRKKEFMEALHRYGMNG